jgi:pyruvate dehydrogenase E1 component beta subunit
MGMGIGAAMTGLRPIVEGMNMGFLLLAFNQVSKPCRGHEQQGHEHE